MHGELARLDPLLRAGVRDQALGQRGALARREHPADHVAAEDVEDDVEIEIRPLGGAQELRDVPAPDLVGPGRQQLRRRVVGAADLVAPLLDLAGRVQEPVHRARRAEIGPLVEQRGMHLRGSLVDEALTVEGVEHGLTLPGIQRTWRRRPRSPRSRWLPPSIHGRAWDPQGGARRRRPHRGARRLDGRHQSSSSFGIGFRGIPRSSATFFWKAMIVSARCRRRSSEPPGGRFEGGLLPLQFRHARIPGRRLPAPLLRRQAVRALPAPGHQMRRGEPFAVAPQGSWTVV